MVTGMFDINVVSDPSAALAPDTPMWNSDLSTFAKYDTELLKPVLLFADTITLRTFRADMISLTDSDEFRFTIMPIKRVYRFLNLSMDRDRDELDYIGINESILAPKAEARRVALTIQGRVERGANAFNYLKKFEEKYEDSIVKVALATAMRLAERR